MQTHETMFRVLMLVMMIFAFVPVVILFSVFAGKISHEAKVETEIINGLVTVSGLIFAFQPMFFIVPKAGKVRVMFMAIFFLEGLLLGFTGYNYVTSTLDLGYLSTITLLCASGSLFINVSMTLFFVFADLLFQSQQPSQKS